MVARTGWIGLIKIELPGGSTIRLSEGVAVSWDGESYVPRDSSYGAIASIDGIEESIGGGVPQLQLTLHPPRTASAAALLIPGAQRARVRAWLAQFDVDLGAVTGSPSLQFDGFLDRAELSRTSGGLELVVAVVSWLEHLFELNIGNSLNPGFHKQVWPGETGEDQATGLSLPDAWGVEAPPRAATTGSSATTMVGRALGL